MQIAITGCGWVTPLAAGEIAAVLSAYANRNENDPGKSQFQRIKHEVLADFPNLPSEAAKEDAVRLAAVALELAWKSAGLTKEYYPSDRKGLVLGSALAGVSGMIDFANDVREQSTRFVSPIRFPQTVGNYIGGALARCYDFRGPASTIACGSASSLAAFREGCALLESGQADVVLAGGTELLNPKLVEGFDQPNISFSDGACLLVLESEAAARNRGAKILAKLESDGDIAAKPRSPKVLVSVAGFDQPDALMMERWTGRTLGADGAAALAAGIGLLKGLVGPWSDRKRIPACAAQELLVCASDDLGCIHELLCLVALD